MSTKIFLNLPVKDLNKSVNFFTNLGYTFNPKFTDENATCMIISEEIYVMLLVQKFFKTFIPNEIADTTKTTACTISLTADSRAEVDAMIDKAVAAGGTTFKAPQDHGFMYGHGYQDLDGHLWEIFWMDETAAASE